MSAWAAGAATLAAGAAACVVVATGVVVLVAAVSAKRAPVLRLMATRAIMIFFMISSVLFAV
jgi:hypothetical protein